MALFGVHIILLLSGVIALLLSGGQPPLWSLPWWWALPLLAPGFLVRRLGRGRVRYLALLSPLLVELGFLFLTDFRELVYGELAPLRIPGWFGLADLLALLPAFVAHISICRQPEGSGSWFSAANLNGRMTVFFWSSLACGLVTTGLLSHWSMARVWIEESSLVALCLPAILLVGMFTVLPRLLLALFETAPLGGDFARTAQVTAARLGVREPRLLEWNTAGLVRNALVLSVLVGRRPVLFTDAILAQLSLPEFQAIVGHELGHVAGRHVGAMVAFMLGMSLLVDHLAGAGSLEDLAVVAVFFALMAKVIGFISRRFELEADLFALESSGELQGIVGGLLQVAGERIHKNGWRHFSVARRITFLRAAHHDPGVARRLRKGTTRIKLASYGLLCAGLLAGLWSSSQHLAAESFWIDVRLGEMDSALERLDGLDDAELRVSEHFRRDDLVRVLTLGSELKEQDGGLYTERLGYLIAGSLDRDLWRAKDLISLAYLLREPELASLGGLVERYKALIQFP